ILSSDEALIPFGIFFSLMSDPRSVPVFHESVNARLTNCASKALILKFGAFFPAANVVSRLMVRCP
ncbi:MAG: hypothetical protein ACRYHA_36120, partial [Janthinobacterium lividum]